jgi:hypothetical protein
MYLPEIQTMVDTLKADMNKINERTGKMVQKALVNVELKRWTVLNAESGIVDTLTDKDFNALLQTNGVKLKGDYVSVDFNHPENTRIQNTKRKIWIDAIINTEYFK